MQAGQRARFAFFQREILAKHATAVELQQVQLIEPPLFCAEMVKVKAEVEEPWSCRGFYARKDLPRLRYRGEPLVEILGGLAAGIGAGP